nr:MAG TPA: hypothetical protein [Caudoviricetes sp.]
MADNQGRPRSLRLTVKTRRAAFVRHAVSCYIKHSHSPHGERGLKSPETTPRPYKNAPQTAEQAEHGAFYIPEDTSGSHRHNARRTSQPHRNQPARKHHQPQQPTTEHQAPHSQGSPQHRQYPPDQTPNTPNDASPHQT